MTAKSTSRSAARLAAVQALFQHQMEKTPVPKLLKEFHADYSTIPPQNPNFVIPEWKKK